MMRVLTSALVLTAGVAAAEDVALLNGSVTLTLPDDFTVARSFGDDTNDGIYAVELGAISIEKMWALENRDAQIPDMDRIESAFGLTFPYETCAEYPEHAPVLPTRCKQVVEMSVIVIPKVWTDAGARFGNQLGMLSKDVVAAWDAGDLDALLNAFCTNQQHPHRREIAREAEQVTCVSDRPALSPHFLSFRLVLNQDYAMVMYAQNIYAETDVILTYGVDDFLALIEEATDIEATLLEATERYTMDKGFDRLHLFHLFDDVRLAT